jgi:hypothetical protein
LSTTFSKIILGLFLAFKNTHSAGFKQQWFMHCADKGRVKREFSVGNSHIASVLERSRLSHSPTI